MQNLNNIKVRAAFQAPPPDIPEGWHVMNAPRPLLGSYRPEIDENQTWSGDFLKGRYYAAVNPTDSKILEFNRDMDAAIIQYIPDPAQAYARLLRHKWQNRPDMLERIGPILAALPQEKIRQDLANKIANLTLAEYRSIYGHPAQT